MSHTEDAVFIKINKPYNNHLLTASDDFNINVASWSATTYSSTGCELCVKVKTT